MIRYFLISVLLFNGFVFSQTLADSLSFENVTSKYAQDKNFVNQFDSSINRWVLFESSPKSLNIKDGNYFEYSPDKRLVIYGSYSRNKEEGWFIYFDSICRVKRSSHFHKGKLEGQTKAYYSTGQLRLSTDYKKGKKDGEMLGFYINGTRLYIGKYKKDKMIGQRMYYNVKGEPANGDMIWRHENGVVKLTGKCINGLPEGRFSHYDEAGNLTLHVDYLRGLPNGEYIVYENGIPVFRECYEAGKFINKQCF